MSDDLHSRNWKIVSHSDPGQPVGVNRTYPAWQVIYIDAPVHDWKLQKADDGKYRLSIGGYAHTGVLEEMIIGSIHAEHEVEWEIVHQKHQHGYTIALAKDPTLGWTIEVKPEGGHYIQIGPIISTHSNPPQFLPTQLFSFEKFD